MGKMKEMYCTEVRKAQSEQMIRQQAEDMENDYLYELFSCLNPRMGDKVVVNLKTRENDKGRD